MSVAGGNYNTMETHGCSISLLVGYGKQITHSQNGTVTYPTIRSYKGGLKVGCTFVSNEALEMIYQWHKDFVKSDGLKNASVVHQKGSL